MKKTAVQYIKCPRCELNYIQKKDRYCEVCKSEMRAGILEENDFDELDEGVELCPVCKVNYIIEGETICSTCQEEQASLIKEDEPDWREFVDIAETEDEELDLLPVEEDEIDEELEGAFAKDLDSEFEEDIEDELEDSAEFDEDDFDVDIDEVDIDEEEDDEEHVEDFEDDDY